MIKHFFIIDSSAILSGKPINIENVTMVTTPGVSDEFSPGGRDYRTFQLLLEKGLEIHAPTPESLQFIKKTAQHTGDYPRLSPADIEILALAVDLNKTAEATILTDDYSIQNVANFLHLKFQGFSQQGITKTFKWSLRCPGCGRRFKESMPICPICGTETKVVFARKGRLK